MAKARPEIFLFSGETKCYMNPLNMLGNFEREAPKLYGSVNTGLVDVTFGQMQGNAVNVSIVRHRMELMCYMPALLCPISA